MVQPHIEISDRASGPPNWKIKNLYPESTEGGRRVSVLKWPKGAPVNLG